MGWRANYRATAHNDNMNRDHDILRGLAAQLRAMASALRWPSANVPGPTSTRSRPTARLITTDVFGCWKEILPDSTLACTDPLFRSWEWDLRSTIYRVEQFKDDHVVEPWFNIAWDIHKGSCGLDIPDIIGEYKNCFHIEPLLTNLPRDLDKLIIPTCPLTATKPTANSSSPPRSSMASSRRASGRPPPDGRCCPFRGAHDRAGKFHDLSL